MKSGEHPNNIKGVNRVVYCVICGQKFSTVPGSKRMTCQAHTAS